MGGLQHDRAMVMTASVIEVVAPLLREQEEIRTAFDAVYTRIRQGLREYEELADRLHRRLHPIPAASKPPCAKGV